MWVGFLRKREEVAFLCNRKNGNPPRGGSSKRPQQRPRALELGWGTGWVQCNAILTAWAKSRHRCITPTKIENHQSRALEPVQHPLEPVQQTRKDDTSTLRRARTTRWVQPAHPQKGLLEGGSKKVVCDAKHVDLLLLALTCSLLDRNIAHRRLKWPAALPPTLTMTLGPCQPKE